MKDYSGSELDQIIFTEMKKYGLEGAIANEKDQAALLDFVDGLWRVAPERKNKIHFRWRGKVFYSTWKSLVTTVYTPEGQKVVEITG